MAGVKGKSGRKDTLITDALRIAMLREAKDKRHKNRIHAMAELMAERAEDGDMDAITFVSDRIEGKPTQTHAHGAAEDLPPINAIQVTYVRSDDKAEDA